MIITIILKRIGVVLYLKKCIILLNILNVKTQLAILLSTYLVQITLNLALLKFFFQHQRKTYALIQNFQLTNVFSNYFKESRYYDLLKQPIDNFYFVLKKNKY